MKKWLITLAMLMIASPLSYATTFAAYHGWCEKGNQKVVTTGLNSTNTVQGSFGACTVTVNLHGGGVATIYSDAGITPIANPFTASADGTVTFFADVSATYDIIETGGTGGGFASPYTLFSVTIGGGGGSGGGSPAGSTNDVQINAGGGAFGGTTGRFQYNPSTQQVTISGTGGITTTASASPVNFGASAVTIPNSVGTVSSINASFCTAGTGATAYAVDAANGQNIFTCGLDGLFHQATGTLPAAPGSPGQLLLNVAGAYGVQTGLFYDVPTAFLHAPGGLSLDGASPFSLQGACPLSTPLGVSASGTALIGWDVGCVPKISINAAATRTIGLQGLIDYTYLLLDANNCLALSPTTGDVGWCRIATGVHGFMNAANTTSPSKLNIYNTFTSQLVGEYVSIGFTSAGPSAGYFIGSDHGSSGGSYHPVLLGAAGAANPFWVIQTPGPLTCISSNPACDIGSVTASQQVRNLWQSGFLSESVIGPEYPVNSGGVQVGLIAAPTATSPVQALTATVAQTTGTLGIVAAVSNGTIPSVTIVSGGSGYVAPTCAFSTPPLNSGTLATCTAHQTAGVIDSITVTNAGANSGYQSIQSTTITITDSGGTGVSLLPVITATTGFAIVAQNGSSLSPIVDGNVTIRRRMGVSTTNAGQLHDTGIACTAPVPTIIQTFGCSTLTSAAGAGASVPMIVAMVEARDVMLLGATPSATTCPTAASIGATCKDTITLSPAMPDTSYFVSCNIASTTTNVPSIVGILSSDKASGSFKVLVDAQTAAAAQVATYDCDARHQ